MFKPQKKLILLCVSIILIVLSGTTGMAADSTPLKVIATNPGNGATNVSVIPTIKIKFSENIRFIGDITKGQSEVALTDNTGNSLPWVNGNITGNVLSIPIPSTLSPNTKYVVKVKNELLVDNESNKAEAFSFSFTTGSILGPWSKSVEIESNTDAGGKLVKVAGTSPDNLKTDVAITTPIKIDFSEKIKKLDGKSYNSLFFRKYTVANPSTNAVNSSEVDKDSYTTTIVSESIIISPKKGWEPGTLYSLSINEYFAEGDSGNPTQACNLSFSTAKKATSSNSTSQPSGSSSSSSSTVKESPPTGSSTPVALELPKPPKSEILTTPGANKSLKFSDLPSNHWAYTAISDMAEKGIIAGFKDGNFKPNAPVTREQFAKMMVLTLNIPIKDVKTATFKDVNTNYWSYKYVEAAKNYLVGYNKTTGLYFKGQDKAKREDIAGALVKAKGYANLKVDIKRLPALFKDSNKITGSLKAYIVTAFDKGIIKGYSDKTFRPQGTLTRAEAAQILYNLSVQ